MEPFFSVIIPLFNKQDYIGATLESVLQQSFTHFEIIIVNDGSTDNSEAVVNEFSDPRIQLINTTNQGVSHARNKGAKAAKSKFLAFLDADDIWYNHHLSDLKFLIDAYANCGLYCMAYDKDFLHSKQSSHLKSYSTNWHGIVKDYFASATKFSLATSSSIAIPTSVYDSIGGFNNLYKSGEDTDLWIRIALEYPVVFYNKISVSLNMYSTNKATLLPSTNLTHFKPELYSEQTKTNRSLDKYLNLNKYSRAVKLKTENHSQEANKLISQINMDYLSSMQKRLIRCPNWFLKFAGRTHRLLKRFNIHLTTFK